MRVISEPPQAIPPVPRASGLWWRDAGGGGIRCAGSALRTPMPAAIPNTAGRVSGAVRTAGSFGVCLGSSADETTHVGIVIVARGSGEER